MPKGDLRVYILPSMFAASLVALALYVVTAPKPTASEAPETETAQPAIELATEPVPASMVTRPTVAHEPTPKDNAEGSSKRLPTSITLPGHVRSWGAPLKIEPDIKSTSIADIAGLTNVAILPESRPINGWVRVSHEGREGYIEDANLALGEAIKAYHRECAYGESERPQSGSLIAGALTGRHVLQLHGLEAVDAVVTLESSRHKGGLAVYVRAGEEAVVRGVAADDYRLSYSAGQRFSMACGIFTRGAKYSENAASLDLKNEAFSETVTLRLRESPRPSA